MARPVDELQPNAACGGAAQPPRPGTSPASPHAGLPAAQLSALLALYHQGQMAEVVRQAAAKVLEFPDAVILHNLLGAAQAAQRQFDEAVASFGRAVQINPDYIEAHNNLGLALQRCGRLDEAVVSFNAALRIDPDCAEAHNNLGVALKLQGRLEDAVANLRKAVQLAPGHAEAHSNLGAALHAQDHVEQAVACFNRAIEIKPRLVEAHSNLCGLYERENRLADLEKALANAMASCGSDNPNILFRLAQLASRRSQFEEAFGYLRKVRIGKVQASQRTACLNLHGRVCDKLGRFDEAFAAFAKQNEVAADSAAARRFNADRYLNAVRSHTAAWTGGVGPAWSDPAARVRTDSPVFLVGFPRSGTTLLDTILRSHAGAAVVEEKPMIGEIVRELSKVFGRKPGVAQLNAISDADIAGLQGIYFRELKKHFDHDYAGKILVDKFPLNMVHADIIDRIFPGAKMILVMRHPCDCVLSCFMQSFRLNDAMANFLDLEQAAKFYVAVMELWSAYRRKLGFEVHLLKYEDLVQDIESTCRPLFGFLELAWDGNVLNYQAAAMERGRIRTPSYSQVTQPLYKQASGRWTNYRKYMEPVLPVLQPWIQAFGYEPPTT